jgi:hypothetical protein
MRSLVYMLALAVPLVLLPAKGAAQSLDGTWNITLNSPEGIFEFPVAISQDGNALNVQAPPGPEPQLTFSGSVDGSSVQFAFETDYQGAPMEITLIGAVSGGRMDGSADFGGLAQGTWTAEKAEE